jgi:hypothetical protein
MTRVALLVLAGCGRFGFAIGERVVDAPPPPIDVVDARPGACDRSAPFGAPAPVSELDTPGIDEQAALSADGLAIYFMSNRAGGSQVFTASRPTVDAPFGTPVRLTSLDSASYDTWNVAITGDGLAAYFVTDQGGADHMYQATRASTFAGFAGKSAMPSPVASGEQPYVVPDGSALYFTSGAAIARASLGQPIATQLQSTLAVPPHQVGIPVVTADERTIYFSVYDSGVFASYDIWMATRVHAADAWSAPVPVSELDTPAFEAPSWISGDGCELYFTRAPDASNWDIYVARR